MEIGGTAPSLGWHTTVACHAVVAVDLQRKSKSKVFSCTAQWSWEHARKFQHCLGGFAVLRHPSGSCWPSLFMESIVTQPSPCTTFPRQSHRKPTPTLLGKACSSLSLIWIAVLALMRVQPSSYQSCLNAKYSGFGLRRHWVGCFLQTRRRTLLSACMWLSLLTILRAGSFSNKGSLGNWQHNLGVFDGVEVSCSSEGEKGYCCCILGGTHAWVCSGACVCTVVCGCGFAVLFLVVI